MNEYAHDNGIETPSVIQFTFEQDIAYGVARIPIEHESTDKSGLYSDSEIEDDIEPAILVGLVASRFDNGTWKVTLLDSVTTLQEVNLSVPFTPQVPPGDWTNTKNCGQTSSAMIYAYFGFYDHTPPVANDITAINNWLSDTYNDDRFKESNGWYTSASQLANLARGFANFTQSYNSNNWTLEQLRQEINAGHPVIIAVYTRMDPSSTTGHFMVLKGFRTDPSNNITHVIVNDPGKTLGNNNVYDVATFINSWQRQNRAVVVVQSSSSTCPTPSLSSPVPDYPSPGETVTFVWTHPGNCNGQNGYYLRVGTSPGGSDVVSNYSSLGLQTNYTFGSQWFN